MRALRLQKSDESGASLSSRASRASKQSARSHSSFRSRNSNRSRSSRCSRGSGQSRQATMFHYGSLLHRLPGKRKEDVRTIEEKTKPEDMFTEKALPIQCPLCPDRFKTKQALAGHLRSNKHRGASCTYVSFCTYFMYMCTVCVDAHVSMFSHMSCLVTFDFSQMFSHSFRHMFSHILV